MMDDGTSASVELVIVIAIEFTVVTARVCTSYPVLPLQKCCIQPLSWFFLALLFA